MFLKSWTLVFALIGFSISSKSFSSVQLQARALTHDIEGTRYQGGITIASRGNLPDDGTRVTTRIRPRGNNPDTVGTRITTGVHHRSINEPRENKPDTVGTRVQTGTHH